MSFKETVLSNLKDFYYSEYTNSDGYTWSGMRFSDTKADHRVLDMGHGVLRYEICEHKIISTGWEIIPNTYLDKCELLQPLLRKLYTVIQNHKDEQEKMIDIRLKKLYQ